MGQKGRQSRQPKAEREEQMTNVELLNTLLAVSGLVIGVAALMNDKNRKR